VTLGVVAVTPDDITARIGLLHGSGSWTADRGMSSIVIYAESTWHRVALGKAVAASDDMTARIGLLRGSRARIVECRKL
jgi:hypothetical protein